MLSQQLSIFKFQKFSSQLLDTAILVKTFFYLHRKILMRIRGYLLVVYEEDII